MTYSRLELTGKVAVVVGGTSGIGRAIAHGLADAGADVVPTSRRTEQVEAAASEIEQRGRRSLRITSDVSDRASLENLLSKTLRAFDKVDILVNSAGRTKRAATVDFSEDDWNSILDTNLTGTLRTCQIFGRHMLERADVGENVKKGSAVFIPATGQYVISGAGYNIWADHDEFQFVWKKMKGDFILNTRAEFVGPKGVEEHRKVGWMVRKTLDGKSPHVNGPDVIDRSRPPAACPP